MKNAMNTNVFHLIEFHFIIHAMRACFPMALKVECMSFSDFIRNVLCQSKHSQSSSTRPIHRHGTQYIFGICEYLWLIGFPLLFVCFSRRKLFKRALNTVTMLVILVERWNTVSVVFATAVTRNNFETMIDDSTTI